MWTYFWALYAVPLIYMSILGAERLSKNEKITIMNSDNSVVIAAGRESAERWRRV